MYAVLCVIDQPEKLDEVLAAWKSNGIGGVTILESTGLHRLSSLPRIPMRYALGSTGTERGNFTLLTVVENEEAVQRCMQITEEITGDFTGPNTGIFIAWSLEFSKGASGKQMTE